MVTSCSTNKKGRRPEKRRRRTDHRDSESRGKQPLKRQRTQRESQHASGGSKKESSEPRRSSEQVQAKPIKIDSRYDVYSLCFLDDGKYFASTNGEGEILRWRVEDGKKMGTVLSDTERNFQDMAPSRDGKWIVTTNSFTGKVRVWSTENYEKVTEFDAEASIIDISLDATQIATAAYNTTLSIWSLSTGQRLLGPLLEHAAHSGIIKFSPNGRFLATAARFCEYVRIYDTQNGQLLADFPFQVGSPWSYSQFLVWMTDSQHLFLSRDRRIYCLNVHSRTTCAQWDIHENGYPTCITLSSNGTFIAASAGSSVSFWDITTYKQIGPIILHETRIQHMDMSSNGDLVIGGDQKIALWNLGDILPSPYSDDILRVRHSKAHAQKTKIIQSNHLHGDSKMLHLERNFEQISTCFINSQRAVKQVKDELENVIKSLHVDLRPLNDSSTNFENIIQELLSFHLKTDSLVQKLDAEFSNARQKADDFIHLRRQKNQCESLFNEGRVVDAARILSEIMLSGSENGIADWLSDFKNKCVTRLEDMGDEASRADRHDDALSAYSVALSLGPSVAHNLLMKWTRKMLLRSSIEDTLAACIQFGLPKPGIQRAICDALEQGGRITEAIKYFQQVRDVFAEGANDLSSWELCFPLRCARKLETLADTAVESKNYKEAVEHLSVMLSLDIVDRKATLAKRCKAWISMGSWEGALEDAQEVLKLKSSDKSREPNGGDMDGKVIEAFETILQRI